MTRAWNQSRHEILVNELRIADTFASRAIGLLNRSSISESEGLWIHQCNSIHTFGMKFAIDCVFLDQNMKVKKIFHRVKPWRMTFPVFGAKSVIELAAGKLQSLNLQIGDQINVGY